MPDLFLDFLKLRHGHGAQLLRAAAFRWLAGAGDWPMVFRAPRPDAAPPRGTSSNVYVHLPFCRSLCPHCPYNKALFEHSLVAGYGHALENELTAYLARAEVPPIRTLYFGGGTPSLTPDLIERVTQLAGPRLVPGAEVGAEVHPRDATPELLRRLREGGVNRISLGVETLQRHLLHSLGRAYTPEQAVSAVAAARAAGFACLDVNLIYGIPGQTGDQAVGDAARILALDVDQISAYPLFGFVHAPLGRRNAAARYGERARLRIQREISRLCRQHGLARTSVWSFTRPGIAPYSTVTHEDYVGFGAGAGSQAGETLWFNTFSIAAYSAQSRRGPALVLHMGERLRRLHWFYWAVYRTHIDAARYRERFGAPVERDFGRAIRALTLLGWAERQRDGWRITEAGAIWAHRLQSLFSLTYIDDLWRRCQSEAWPDEVVLA